MNPDRKKKLQSGFQGICEGVEKSFDKSAGKGPDKIHRLRVSMKILKAAANFLAFVTQKDLKFPPPLKRLYQLAGKTRERNILLRQLKILEMKYDQDFSKIRRTLIKQEEIAREKFIGIKSGPMKKSLREFSRNYYHRLEDRVSRSSCREYFEQEISNCSALLSLRSHDPGHWHELRRKIKEMTYNAGYCKGVIKFVRPVIDIRDRLHPMLETIGRWHDVNVLNGFLAGQTRNVKSGKIRQIVIAQQRAESQFIKYFNENRTEWRHLIERVFALKVESRVKRPASH